ncbi:hypothetical protein PACTADRAFT_451 [Pachysolen tannophilus NRRL Y-2460]|uniref:Uncharacterized protein n=1 Tax=Pachysolen tannophilus NRRL Y-2460 TaxID=669874 RepID=A0A1E4U1T7_PACTA|nr:hypothetical protein PACTADRAFT_451 [Pachysolen tannophilus NRRL Y-2460]
MNATNLIEFQKQYFLHILSAIKTSNNLKCLIIDEKTEKILHYLVEPNVLLRYVTSVERVDKKRKTQISIEGIYFLEPTKFSINCLLCDFTVEPNRYKKCHLLLLPGISDTSRNSIMSNKSLKYNLVSMQNCYLNLMPLESQIFFTDNLNSLEIYFNPACIDILSHQIQQTVNNLINLCVITGEYPMIRYYSPKDAINESATLPFLIAKKFQDDLDEYARSHNDFPPATNQRPRSIFIITDRTIDLFSPLLHEFTYQAMCFDLIDFPNNKNGYYDNEYTYDAENERNEKITKTSKLNDLDEDWVSLRHLHILEASETLVSKVNELIMKNPLMVDRSNASTSTDLLFIVAHLKNFDEERRRITLHKILIDELLKVNNERKLAESSDFEQNCVANGIGFDGEKLGKSSVTRALLELLAQDIYKEGDKLRFILIYALFRGGLIEQDLIKLLNFANMSPLQPVIFKIFANFENLGFRLLKPNLKTKRFRKETYHDINNEGAFNTSRFKPAINTVVESALNNTLDETTFPYIKDKPLNLADDPQDGNGFMTDGNISLKNPKHKASWAKNKLTTDGNKNYFPPRQRIFYFIAGGVTYSEVRSCYELSDRLNKDVIVGSDELITPRDFVNEMINLNNDNREELNLYYDYKLAKNTQPPPKFLLENEEEQAKKSNVHDKKHDHHREKHDKKNEKKDKEKKSEAKNLHLQNKVTEDIDENEKGDAKKNKIRHKFSKFLK